MVGNSVAKKCQHSSGAVSLAVAPGTSVAAEDASASSRATVESEAMDAAVKKATDDVAAAERVAIDKMAIDAAVEEMAVADAVAAEGANPQRAT
jgi:hypothetical protein